MPSADQCAVGTDGKLLDESEIVWYNDADDLVPIAPLVPSTSSVLKATTLHAFFNGASTPGPAVFVAGARRSSRVSKPSKRVRSLLSPTYTARSPRTVRAVRGQS